MSTMGAWCLYFDRPDDFSSAPTENNNNKIPGTLSQCSEQEFNWVLLRATDIKCALWACYQHAKLKSNKMFSLYYFFPHVEKRPLFIGVYTTWKCSPILACEIQFWDQSTCGDALQYPDSKSIDKTNRKFQQWLSLMLEDDWINNVILWKARNSKENRGFIWMTCTIYLTLLTK